VEQLLKDSTNWRESSSTNNAATKSAAASPDTNSPLQMATFASSALKVWFKTHFKETDVPEEPAKVRTSFKTHLMRRCAEDVKPVNGLTTCQTHREMLVSRDYQPNVLALKDNLLTHIPVKNAQLEPSKIQRTHSNV
jgi:hypothetical protein